MDFSLEEQMDKFKSLSHRDKLRKIKWIFSILWDDAWNEISSMRDTINMFENEVSDDELEWIYQSMLELMIEFERQNGNNVLSV